MKTNQIKAVFPCLLAVAMLSACSAKVTSPDGGGAIPPLTVGGTPSGSTTGTGTSASPLEGKWVLGCTGMNGLYIESETTFTDNAFSSSAQIFSDPNCANLVQSQSKTGTFTLPAAGQIDLESSDGTMSYDVYEIDGNILYLGNGSSDPSARPTDVNRQLPYQQTSS